MLCNIENIIIIYFGKGGGVDGRRDISNAKEAFNDRPTDNDETQSVTIPTVQVRSRALIRDFRRMLKPGRERSTFLE